MENQNGSRGELMASINEYILINMLVSMDGYI
jgi:hypothetical protein